MRKKKTAMIDPKEILTMARVMRDQSVELSRSGRRPFYWCLFCDAKLYGDTVSPLVFIHDPECPTRIADKVIRAANTGVVRGKRRSARPAKKRAA